MKRLVVLLVLLAVEGSALADGAWVHGEIGPGWVVVHDRYYDYNATGSGASVGLAVGGHVKPRWIVFGAVGGTFASAPTMDFGGSAVETTPDDQISSTSIGAGVLYEPKPGLYLGGGLTSQHVRVDVPLYVMTTDRGLGLGLSLRAGKEWKVGQHVRIGGMLRFEAASNETSNYSQAVNELALLFSGSYF